MANCNKQQLNITCGTDVVLHDTLIFDGETFDPALSTGITANLVSYLGKRTALEVEVADGGLIIYVPWQERNAGYYGLEVTGTCNSKKWATYADSLIRYTRATEMGVAEVTIESDYYDITQVVGFKYSTSPIKSVTASVDAEVGTPSVEYQYDGKNINFDFHNLKGNRGNGITSSSEVLSPDDGGTNTHTFTDDDGNEHTFHTKNGRRGIQGDSFQPIEDVSGLVLAHTTGQDNTKAMSQKGVTDAIGEYQELTLTRISKAYIKTDNSTITSSEIQHCWWAPVKAGDIVKIVASNSSTQAFRIGWAALKPVIGTVLTSVEAINIGGTVDAIKVAASDGYVVINHSSSSYSARSVKVLKYAKAAELGSKVSVVSMMDLVNASSVILSDSALTVSSVANNSLSIEGNIANPYSASYKIYKFLVQEGKIYKIKGITPKGIGYAGYVFYDENDAMVEYGEQGVALEGKEFDTMVVCPKGATYIYISGFDSGTTSIPGELYEIAPPTTETQKAQVRKNLGIADLGWKTIYPKMCWGYTSTVTGKMFPNTNAFVAKNCLMTIRYIKVSGDFTVLAPYDCVLTVLRYDETFTYIGYTQYTDIQSETVQTIEANDAAYVKLMLIKPMQDGESTYPSIPMTRLAVTGMFGNDWDVYNVDEKDGGRTLLPVWVRVTDPSACDDETNDVQDAGELKPDYGRIYLPKTYTNTGEPTRLIIYCHGAAVNYSSSTIDTDEAADLEPDYWLAEGYAILDVEGNPFNNTNRHYFMPQAMECYIAAYKWAVECYNIKRDGVFLGGRSMGGSMAFNLLRNECPIPVIAACPNVPMGTPTWGWNKIDDDARAFTASHLGFAEQPTWSSTSPMPTAEWNCLKANWDKLVKYSPMWSLMTDLPDMSILMDDDLNVSPNQSPDVSESGAAKEYALYSSHKIKAKAPVKIFAIKDDTTCPYKRCAMLWYNMLLNGASIVELRLFESGGHHADTQNDSMKTTVTTKFGETLTQIPVVYVEMLRFWRRYEQE